MDRKPNLFIPGAPKAGTTFLYEALRVHPDVFFPKIKELNHFSYDELISNSYYKDYKVQDEKKYLDFYKGASQKYLVDGSVSYFAYPSVAKKIYEFNKSAKIVVAIRNPIKRAFSHYQMDLRMGNANLPFGDYIRHPKGSPRYIQYIQNSMYHQNIIPFIELFGKENVKIIILENIKEELENLNKFLEIPSVQTNSETKVNENKVPRNFLARYFQRNRKIVSILKFIVPIGLINQLRGLLYKSAPKTSIDDESAIFLYNCFKNDIDELSKLLNKDLTKIWNLNTKNDDKGD